MFKDCLLLLLFIVFVSVSFAQYPLINNSNILINSRNLGDDLLLFLPDTASQILFNPARAFTYDKNFIYTTYYSNYSSSVYSSGTVFTRIGDVIIYDTGNPITYSRSYSSFPAYSSIAPTISIATLLNINNSKWLLAFSNGIEHSDNQYLDNESRVFEYSSSIVTEIINREFSTKEEMSTNSIHITKIEQNYSIGLFTAINQSNIHRTDLSLNDRKSNYDHFQLYDYLKQETIYKNSGDQYQFGVLFSLMGEDWDYIGKISYQQSDYEYDGRQKVHRNDIDSMATDSTLTSWNTQESFEFGDGSTIIKSIPKYYRIYNYYQTKADWISENDHIFFKADAIYSIDNFDYISNLNEIYYYGYNDTIMNSGGTSAADHGILETNNYWITISAGYVMKFTLDDISVLMAINPEYQYFDLEDIFSDRGRYLGFPQGYILYRDKTMNSFSLQLPLYFNFAPTSWIEFYGGIIYRYGYNAKSEKRNTLFDPSVTLENRQLEEYEISDGTSASSFKSKFLGINLKHKSGLRLQMAFNSDIFDISRWNFSLGYHF